MYFIFGTIRVIKRRESNQRRFEEFESSLKSRITDYVCFTNNHPYVWGEESYADNKNALLESPGWDGMSMFPSAGDEFSLRVDEDKKFIYLAKGSDSFDWSSLCHKEEWNKRKVIYY